MKYSAKDAKVGEAYTSVRCLFKGFIPSPREIIINNALWGLLFGLACLLSSINPKRS